MKTPGEILFERHRDAEAELEAICQHVLADLPHQAPGEPSSLLERCWQELFWSCRRAWTVIAVAWGIMILVNLSVTEQAPPDSGLARLSPEEIAWLMKENARWRTSLVEPPPQPEPATAPRPRSGARSSASSSSRSM